MEKKKFFSDLLFVQGINILIKAIWILVIDRAVQNLLPEEDYGTYFSLFSFTVLFIIFLDMGINNLNIRSVASDRSYYTKNFVGLMAAKFGLSIVFSILVYITGRILEFSDDQMLLLLPLIVYQIFISFNQYLRSNISAMHLFKLDGILAVTDRLFVILVCGSWFLFDSLAHFLTIQNFILVQLMGTIITFSLGLFFNAKYIGAIELKLHLPAISKLIFSSLPYALLAALMAFFTRVDAVMIKQMLGESEVDRYAMAYRLLDAGNMIAVLLAGMLFPLFSRLINNKSEISTLTSWSMRLLVVPAIIMASMVWVHSNAILDLMYPMKMAISAPDTFSILMWSFTCICLIYIFGTLLTAAGDLKFLNYLAAGMSIFNVVLNYFLIPEIGIKGAALATFLTQGVFAIGCFLRSYRWRNTLKIRQLEMISILGLLAFSIIFYHTKQFFESPFVHISIGVVAALVFVVTSGIINIDILKRMSRRKTQEPSDI